MRVWRALILLALLAAGAYAYRALWGFETRQRQMVENLRDHVTPKIEKLLAQMFVETKPIIWGWSSGPLTHASSGGYGHSRHGKMVACRKSYRIEISGSYLGDSSLQSYFVKLHYPYYHSGRNEEGPPPPEPTLGAVRRWGFSDTFLRSATHQGELANYIVKEFQGHELSVNVSELWMEVSLSGVEPGSWLAKLYR